VGVVIAVDAGTTGVRSMAVGEDGRPVAARYQEFPQHYPRPGWVEHDPMEIWRATSDTIAAVLADVDARTEDPPPGGPGAGRGRGVPVAALGLTNQRETVVVWDRASGRPLGPAIVWQDRRTAGRCDALRAAGHEDLLRVRTGLVLDPYFSATKLGWLFSEGGIEPGPDVAVGTVDSWLLWNLTAGTVHATDVTNASRTLLLDLRDLAWDPELCALFDVPVGALPDVVPSSGRVAVTAPDVVGGLPAGIPVSGIAGDQHAALFGQACFRPGMAKNTYGTGSFVLVNAGDRCPEPVDGLLTTVAWSLAAPAQVAYALEGSVFVTGAGIQWLRDELGLIERAADIGPLAESVPDAGGAYFIPALTGLGSPWWDPYARGTLVGLSRGVGRPHLARAVVEAIALQTRDVVEVMAAAGHRPHELRVDGGASVMDLLLRLQADLLGVPVVRAAVGETTALGAALLAGLAEGVWSSLDEIAGQWRSDRVVPPGPPDAGDALYAGWVRAVERARQWASVGAP
jgi:glycerol kinase